ncbi:IPT/TIG domain-containing protein [Caminicella sporogenes DSM 14501]|uniref:IPT/TIG domain-containing protein n=1 Tax=Caminicella sporogenes DSM 14501 TaxID=1121266 RepID=A0A1M6PRC8_9FIRM|nr:IPT/TIG domain-containing protein [Caminicella sporogenes]RKD22005.1 hypothetical protein BET04_07075 [Caminicella sporogenes]SHK10524.1 IPT/TIG domain-containing protein [Caminicella sporogenes DSM 14501]
MNIFKRILAVVVSLIMIFTGLPLSDILAYGFDSQNFKVDKVEIYKVYDRNRNPKSMILSIRGVNLKDAQIFINTDVGAYIPLTDRQINEEYLLQFGLNENQIGKTILIGNVSIEINEGEMPTLSGITRTVERGKDDLVISGANLDKIKDNDEINARYGKGSSQTYFAPSYFNDSSQVTIPKPTGELGLQNIVFEKKTTVKKDFPEYADTDVSVEVRYTYEDQFRFVDELSNLSDLNIFPNRGEKGDKVYFTAKTLDNYDVFFLKKIDGTEPYTRENMGKNKTFKQDSGANEDEDVLTVEVPDIEIGEYYIVLTNAISDNGDPMEEINQTYVVRVDNSDPSSPPEKFYVIDGSTKPSILGVQPNSGPDTGQKTTITGEFLGTLKIPEFKPNDESKFTARVESPIGDADKETLKISYDDDDIQGNVIGKYRDFDVESVERTISVIIGGRATFAADSSGEKYDYSFTDTLDTIQIFTPQINDAEENPVKDVVIEITTTFKTSDGKSIVLKDRAEMKDGYTYVPSKITPKIKEVVPNKIHVEKSGDKYSPKEITIGIYGENFTVHKFVYGDDNTEITRYPIIDLGPEIHLNPNEDSTIELKVFNEQGQELDGTEGLEMGSKILVKIPANKLITNLGKTYVRVTNPVRNSLNPGIYDQLADAIMFVLPAENKIPVISEVTPNVVTVDGGEEVCIEGSNFQDGVKVFIDGMEVENIKRSEDGKEITFTAPPGREGETQLIVMNVEGGMDTYPFTYVTTYTNPKIIDFSPKKGNTGTLVVVEGDNFLKPDPTASEDEIFKLIGTRILLEGKDINEYNRDPETRKIELTKYSAPSGKELIKLTLDGSVEAEDYYHSIVLKDEENKKFYIVDVDADGNVVISDGVNENYKIINDGGSLKAEREGVGLLDVSVYSDKITIGTKELLIMTPFLIQDGEIVGDNVKVFSKNKIYFKVPILNVDGYYDVTVVNHDTKKDSKIDEEGFYYYRQPQSNPEITEIEPSQGSTEGGYSITIKGNEFVDDGTNKTKVIINGIEISEEDIWVSIDGKEISVVVPPYPGDLRKEYDTDRLTVPVVVVNPDGGSASKEDGFTYVVPISNPQISEVFPKNGSAAGGDIVEISGTDFRYFEPYDDDNRDQERNSDEKFQNLNKTFEDENGISNDWDDLLKNPVRDNVDLREPKDIDHKIFDKYYSSPILPKVFFGGKEAKIVEFGVGYIKVITPPNEAGEVDLYIVNNDSGVSNKVKFTYEASNPIIKEIVPNEGRKQGKDKIEISGENFKESSMNIYGYDESNNIHLNTKFMTKVRFGDITNKDIPRDEENSGLINNGRTTVKFDGGLTVEYNANDKILNVRIESGDSIYEIPEGIHGYEGSEVYIPVSMLKDKSGNIYAGYELIRVYVDDRRLFVERGYAPEVIYESSGKIIAISPSYYTIGTVSLTVINPDGGEAKGEFTYKNPDSKPRITDITKDGRPPIQIEDNGIIKRVIEVTYKGGNIISIIGDDFRENAIIKIGDILTLEPSNIDYSLPGKMTFTMPAVSEDNTQILYRVVVVNEDGGVASSDEAQPPIYIRFIKVETSPSIEEVTPNVGPASGGTEVIIKGKNFIKEMEGRNLSVFFGEVKVPDEDFEVIDYKTIKVYKTPPNTAGTVDVKVENPDGALSSPSGSFTYISSPKVIAVVDPNDSYETARIRSISVKGGQKVKIKGSGFIEGAKVVFAPEIEKIESDENASGDTIYINGLAYRLVSGNYATEIEFIDGETLTVVTPEGKLNTKGVIVINPDGGATQVYEDIIYGLPEVASPSGVSAELVYDRYIKIHWNEVADVNEYEIYVVKNDREYEFIGSTKLTSFLYEELEPHTRYKFVVKAIGEYGSSKYSEESNEVKTGRRVGPEDDDEGLVENSKFEKIGNIAQVIIGTSDYDDEDIVIDLTKGNLVGSKEVVISMPAEVVASTDAKDIIVNGEDFRVKFNPKSFYSSKIDDNKRDEDSGVRFTIKPSENINMIGNSKSLSSVYELSADIFIGSEMFEISYLIAPVEVTLDVDIAKARMRKMKAVSLSLYDSYEDKWIPIAMASDGDMSVTGLADSLGKFTIIGSRK